MPGYRLPQGGSRIDRTRRLEFTFDGAKVGGFAGDTVASALIASGRTPPPVYEKRCESCSLMAECLPKTIQKRRSVKSYLKRILGET